MSDDFDYQSEYQHISVILEDFAKDSEDTVMAILLRLIAEYHDMKADKFWGALDREKQKQK